MNVFRLIGLFIAVMPVWAQLSQSAEHRYFVPLPGTKSVAVAAWQFYLEATALEALDFNIRIVQHDIRGRQLSSVDFGLQPAHRVFTWLSENEAASGRLRALEIVSDQALTGQLWMWNDLFGQLNGVTLAEQLASSLVLPHIPENFFEITTTFSVQGVSQSGSPSNVGFVFYDQGFQPHEPSVLRSNWPSNGYLIFTPEVTLAIGNLDEDVRASWGRVFAEDDDYLLAGFQTFTSEDAAEDQVYIRTAATELSGEGLAEGHLIFDLEQSAFEDQIIMTNPHQQTARVDFQLFTKVVDPEPVEETETYRLREQTWSLDILPLQKQSLVMGDTLFPEVEGVPLRLLYRAATLPDEEGNTQPLPLFALHLQNHLESLAMGGHHLAKAGTHIHSWLSLSPEFETRLDIVSTGIEKVVVPEEDPSGQKPGELGQNENAPEPERIREVSLVEITLVNESQVAGPTRHPIQAGQVFSLNSQEIADLFKELFEIEIVDSVQVDIHVVSGPPVAAKVTGSRENDIAILNPHTATPAPDEEPVEEE